MGIISGDGVVPRIGSTVRLPNGRQGTVEGIYNVPLLSRITQSLYYKVKWNDGNGRTRYYSFYQLEVEGHPIGESKW